MAKIEMTSKRPLEPRHDMEIRISFVKDKGSPSRIFLAATDMIQAFEQMDKVLIKSISSEITPLLMLEDVEVGSLKIILTNVLNNIDDEALKAMDLKAIVGSFLVKGKYKILKWMDTDEPSKNLPKLRKEIQLLAVETGVRRLPDYPPIDPTSLTHAVKKVQSSKERLIEGDAIYYKGIGVDKEYDLDMDVRMDSNAILDIAIKTTNITPPIPMRLAIKEPGHSNPFKWKMRHGRRDISVRINDDTFLREFQKREVDVRPNDFLRCRVQIEMKYGYDNKLISETFTISSVEEVIQGYNDQKRLTDTDFELLPDHFPKDLTIPPNSLQSVRPPQDEEFNFPVPSNNTRAIPLHAHFTMPENLTDITPPISIMLAVKKPASSKYSNWEMHHGKRTISAIMMDESFLLEFQERKIDVRPNDVLRCTVQIEMRYEDDNELLSETYLIVSVDEVLQDDNYR